MRKNVNTSNKQRPEKKNKLLRRILVLILSVVIIVPGFFAVHNFTHISHALHSMDEYRKMYPSVDIQQYTDDIIKISGPEGCTTGSGILFYPGATVEYSAYIPLLSEIASEGYDVYIFSMPLRMALLAPERADEVTESAADIENWFIAGHSAGGAAAAAYAQKNYKNLRGIVILSSATKSDLSETDLPLLSVFGTLDSVVGDSYKKKAGNNPEDTVIDMIDGGNHAQFGDYGRQMMDTDASVSAEEQRRIAAEDIVKWLESHI